MLTESRDRIKGLIQAIKKTWHAEMTYFGEYGLEHEEDCPEDDTCRCPACQPWYEADEFAGRQIELAERRLDKIRKALEELHKGKVSNYGGSGLY